MSRAVIYTSFGGPDALTLREVPEPHAGPGQVRVRVTAVALNPMDWLLPSMPALAAAFGVTLPAGFAQDLAGVVDEVGPGVRGFAPGDRVHGSAVARAAADFAVLTVDDGIPAAPPGERPPTGPHPAPGAARAGEPARTSVHIPGGPAGTSAHTAGDPGGAGAHTPGGPAGVSAQTTGEPARTSAHAAGDPGRTNAHAAGEAPPRPAWSRLRDSVLMRTPAGVPDEVASTVATAGLTADAALAAIGVRSGDTVLVGGAAGGVGVFAVQLARLAGATVIGTGAAGTAGFLRGLGAEPVAYGPGLAGRLRALGPAFRITAATALVGAETVEAALALGVAPDRISTIAAGPRPPGGVRATGAAGATPGALERVTAAIAAGRLVVPVAATFPLTRFREAVALQRSGHVHGKVVITP